MSCPLVKLMCKGTSLLILISLKLCFTEFTWCLPNSSIGHKEQSFPRPFLHVTLVFDKYVKFFTDYFFFILKEKIKEIWIEPLSSQLFFLFFFSFSLSRLFSFLTPTFLRCRMKTVHCMQDVMIYVPSEITMFAILGVFAIFVIITDFSLKSVLFIMLIFCRTIIIPVFNSWIMDQI